MLRLCLLAALALCASAFVPAAAPAPLVRSAVSSSLAVTGAGLQMTSVNKKAKAQSRKQKSSRAATKRFKVTSTGKLLRHYAGKAHLLRRKRPQHLARLRKVGQVHESELDTYQKLLLVFPKRK